jgi:hypothetical protein
MREKVLGVPTILIYKDGVKAATFTKGFTADEVRIAVGELRLG